MSPIPLGFWATAGAGGGAAPAFELIETVYPSTSSAVFSSIPQTYKHLQVRGVQTGITNCTLTMFVNNEATPSTHRFYGEQNTGVTADKTTGSSGFQFISRTTYPYVEQEFAPIIIDIPDYASTVKNKTIRAFSGQTNGANGAWVMLASGASYSTTAINSVTLQPNPAFNFATGTRFSLYGIKG